MKRGSRSMDEFIEFARSYGVSHRRYTDVRCK